MIILVQFLIASLIMGLIDAVWLDTMYKLIYQPTIGHLMLDKPNFIAAAIFYLMYVAALVYLIINPAINKANFSQLLINSAVFGAICYATYDLTNLATIKGFSAKIAVIDIIWGAVLTATVSSLTYLIIKKIF